MPCATIQLPGGGYAIVHYAKPRSKKCYVCGRPAPVLCDYPDASHKSGTCDRPCCRTHAKSVGVDRDYCREHGEGA